MEWPPDNLRITWRLGPRRNGTHIVAPAPQSVEMVGPSKWPSFSTYKHRTRPECQLALSELSSSSLASLIPKGKAGTLCVVVERRLSVVGLGQSIHGQWHVDWG